jgi:hypothetical protein
MKSTFGIFLVGLSLVVSSTIAFAGGGAPPATPVAEVSPDVNGDLKSDFIVEDLTTGFTVVSFLDGVSAPTSTGVIQQTNVAAGFTTAGYPDLNGDGKSDKVVEAANGFSVGFLLDGLTTTAAQVIPGTNVGAGYVTVGFPDLNGDGKADKVVENTTTGHTVAFLMDGLNLLEAGAIPGTNVGAGYTTVGFPDINGDGKADKVVQSDSGYTVAFVMNGLIVDSAGPISGTNVGAGYSTAGFPDVNGDGKADKVVEGADGYSVAFLLDGTDALLGAGPIAGTNIGNSFVTVGFPDINGDGNDDKVIESISTGRTVAFLLDGTDALLGAGGIAGTPIGAGWALAGFPDLDGDGDADKVISRASDGRNYGYLLDGLTTDDDGELPSTPTNTVQADWDERWNP